LTPILLNSKAWPKTITDRDTISAECAGTKFAVIVDQVQVGFGTNKQIAPDVEANSASEMSGEMITADVVRASHEITGIDSRVETKILASYPGH
jgi:hypothetical protein